MSTIPLPALHIDPPEQQDTLGNFARLMQLKQAVQNAPLQQQALQQQVQAGALENQQRQRSLEASQALQNASAGSMTKDESGNATFDPDKFQQAIAGTPAFTPETIENLTKMQQARVSLQNSQADLQNKVSDMKGYAAAAVKAANYDPTVAHSLLDSLNVPGPQAAQMRSVIDNPQMLKQWVDTTVAQSPAQQKMQNEKDIAGIRANNVEMQEMRDWMQKNPGKTPADYQQFKVNQGVQAAVDKETNPQVVQAKVKTAAAEAAARQPYEMQLAAQRQALSQGDPNAAGQLLVNGDATLSELKARGATPDFIQKTLTAAHQLSGGQFNAQQADAEFSVAKSPANTGFFGSAGSLIDKGGTLDQLATAGKTIPQNQIPAFNKLADWEKAATGSGPLAHYATTVLGVADDYAKVMGGGVGSDASRQQAIDLIKPSASPEARAGAIQGIRDSVNSQGVSRIGSNKTMQRMYGSHFTANGSTGNVVMMKAPNGQTKAVPADQVDHYKQLGATVAQ